MIASIRRGVRDAARPAGGGALFDGNARTDTLDIDAPLPDLVKGFVKAPYLASSKYGKSFLRGLSPAKTKTVSRATLVRVETAAAVLEKTAAKLSLEARLLGPLELSKEADGVAFLGVFTSRGRPAGFFGYVVKTAKDGTLIGELHSAYFDKAGIPMSGVAEAILGFTGQTLAPAMGVRREVLKADYAGRYVWAKGGFHFNPDYRYYDIDGKTCKTVELARRNLARFLKANKLQVEDLRLRGKRLASLEDLVAPDDFAGLVHRQGRRVWVRPLVAQDTVGEGTELPVGKAFMLASYLPEAAPYVLSQGGPRFGTKFDSRAMPWWNGYRDLPAE